MTKCYARDILMMIKRTTFNSAFGFLENKEEDDDEGPVLHTRLYGVVSV